MHTSLASYGWLALAILLEVVGQLLFKAGVSPTAQRPQSERSFIARVVNPWIVAGVAAYLAELLAWIAALSLLPLSEAFPLLSLSYGGVAIAAWLVFDEKLRVRAMVGIALLTAGATLMLA